MRHDAILLTSLDTEEQQERPKFCPKSKFALAFGSMLGKLSREAHPAEELFTGALQEAALSDDLLRKVGGERSMAERLIEYRKRLKPHATRLTSAKRDQSLGTGEPLSSRVSLS